MGRGSIHDVFSEPLAPFRCLARAQLGIDVDLLLPLPSGREDTGELGNLRIELSVEDSWTTLLLPGNFGLNFGVVKRVRSTCFDPFIMATVSIPSTAPSFGITTVIGTPWPIM